MVPSEHVGHGDAHGDGDDDQDGGDAGLQVAHEAGGVQVVNLQDGEQEAVEEHAGDQGDHRGDGEGQDGGVQPSRQAPHDDADGRGSHEGRLRSVHMEGDQHGVADGQGQQTAQGDEEQQPPGHVEVHGEASRHHKGRGQGGKGQMVRQHTDRGEIGNREQGHRHGDAEGDAGDDEEGVAQPGHAGDDIVVQKVVDGVDHGHTGNHEQGAADHGVEEGLLVGEEGVGEAGGHGGQEGARRNPHIDVETPPLAELVPQKAQQGGQHGDDGGGQGATEEDGQGAGPQADGQPGEPQRIKRRQGLHPLQLTGEPFQGPVLLQGSPGKAAQLRQGVHVHLVGVDLAEGGGAVGLVVDVDHDGVVVDVDVQVILGNPHVDGGPPQVALDMVGIGAVLHEELPHGQQQAQFLLDPAEGMGEGRLRTDMLRNGQSGVLFHE